MIDNIGNIQKLLQFSDTVFFDDHDDESLSTSLWQTAVVTGSTTVAESATAPNTLRIANPGTGTTGYGQIQTVSPFRRNTSIRSEIEVHDGEAAANGERCLARIELYTDADDYVYFGLIRDTSDAINSRGYIWYNLAGAGEVTVDIDTTDIDNIAREYRIDVTGENILFFIDDILVYTLQNITLDNYFVIPYAETQVNTDVIDIRFNYNKVLRFNEDQRLIYKQLLAIQGGDDSIGTITNALNNSLDLGYEDGALVSDGTEQTIYDESDDRPFIFRNVDIDTTNMAANSATDSITIRKYKRVKSGGDLILMNTINYVGIQAVPLKIITGLGEGVKYGARVTLEQTVFDGVEGAAMVDTPAAPADDTADANSAAANDVALLPAVPIIDDAFYIGGSTPFQRVQINVGQAGNDVTSDWEITWQYWDGDSWEDLANVTDNTDSFCTAGSNSLLFDEPDDWAEHNAAPEGALPVNSYWIRGIVTTAGGGGATTQPLGTQIWIYPDYEYAIYDEMT